jgi:predicted glycosyltransferase
MNRRFVLCSYDTGTLGHARRCLHIASALSNRCEEALVLIVGAAEFLLQHGLPPRVDVLRLPALSRERPESASYVSTQWGACGEWFWSMRRAVIERVLVETTPDAVLVDYKAPGVRGELVAGLRRLKQRSPSSRLVLGLRDIPHVDDDLKRKWQRDGTRELLDGLYDEVLVYGHPEVFDTVGRFGLPESRSSYVGYVLPPPLEADAALDRSDDERRVFVMAGGGTYLHELAEIVLPAWRSLPDDERPVLELQSGPYCRRAVCDAVAGQRDDRVRLLAPVADPRLRMRSASLVVLQGGPASMIEAVSLGIRPQVVARRGRPGFEVNLEQAVRAERFAELGLVDLLPDDPGEQLREAFRRVALGSWRPHTPDPTSAARVCQDGADEAAGRLLG